MVAPIPAGVDRELSRKWRLAQVSIRAIIVTTGALLAAGLVFFWLDKFEADDLIEYAKVVLSTLTWGIAAVLGLYGTVNVVSEKLGGGK